ncbi:MAG: hypothetical protein ACOYK1_07420 [Vampirovibrionia bacterium]|jgi:hypothetical protein
MNLGIAVIATMAATLFAADKCVSQRVATATQSAEGGFSALGNRQDGVNLAAKPH